MWWVVPGIWVKIKCKVRCVASPQTVPWRADGVLSGKDAKVSKHRLGAPGLAPYSLPELPG